MIHAESGLGVEVDCPHCQAVLAFTPDDLATLEAGDLLTCDTCGTALTVQAGLAGLSLQVLGASCTCPHCQAKLAASLELLQLLEHQADGLEGASVTCPQCAKPIEVQFESLGGGYGTA